MVSPKAKCDECGRTFNKKSLTRVKGKDGLFCHNCKQRVGNIIPVFSEIPKTRKKYYVPKPKKDVEPKIPGAKKKTRKRVSIGNYIYFDEWKFLFRKHMESGLDYEEAKIKIKDFKLFLKNQAKKLKDEKKSEEEIKNKLREKFEKGWAELMEEEK